MIEAELYEHLKANVPLVQGRVFANVMAEKTPKPAMVYRVESENIARKLTLGVGGCSASSNLPSEISWEIYTFSEEYLKNKEVKNEVVAAINSFTHSLRDIEVSDAYDEETELFVQIIKFKTKE